MRRFPGFQKTDFSIAVRGTHWRHRHALGGEIRMYLRRVYGRRYQTWGLPGTNIMHIARRAEYVFPPQQVQNRLFIAATTHDLVWGIELPGTGPDSRPLHDRLLSGGPALPLLLFLLHAYDLTLSDISDASGGAIGGCWRFDQGRLTWLEACSLPRAVTADDIPYRLSDLPADWPHPLSLYARAPAGDVIAWGHHAAEHLVPVLIALVPLYELCLQPI